MLYLLRPVPVFDVKSEAQVLAGKFRELMKKGEKRSYKKTNAGWV